MKKIRKSNNKKINKIYENKYTKMIIFLVVIAISLVSIGFIHSAITAEELDGCEMNLHQHTDQCYDNEKNLICGYADYVVHKHDENCYNQDGTLICELPEIEEHVHTNECYDANKNLVCEKKEVILHQHTSECYNNGKLICGKLQVQKHQHAKSCFNKNNMKEDIETVAGNANVNSDKNDIKTEHTDTMTVEAEQPEPLDVTKYITEAKVSYWQDTDEKWKPITNETMDVPGDATVKLDVKYENVKISELKNAGYTMKFELPKLLKDPVASGNITEGQTIIGKISSSKNSVIIEFNKNWINKHHNDNTINGDFFVKSQFDGSHVGEGKPGELVIGGIHITVNFEEDVAAKHGNVSIKKSAPEFIEDNEDIFLQYTLTVKVPEGAATVPDVKVVDQFTKNAEYIEEYVGVTGHKSELKDNSGPIETCPDNSEKGQFYLGNKNNTSDTSPIPNPAGDKLIKPGVLVWEIGKMQAGETRTLTYKVKLKDNYKGVNKKGNSVDIVNAAAVYSKQYFRKEATSKYQPNIHVTLSKTSEPNINPLPDGSKEITYKIVVSANENNTYTVENVKVSDYFEKQELTPYIEYIENSFNLYNGENTDEIKKIEMDSVKPKGVANNPTIINQNTSPKKKFDLYIGSLKPNEKKTITYKVKIKPEFFIKNNGNIDLLNRAEIYSDDRYDGGNKNYEGYTHKKTITCTKKSRKLVGEFSTEEKNVQIPENQDVYEKHGNQYQKVNNLSQFTIPAYNQEYKLVVNEEGVLDFSEVVFTDTLREKQMQHTGYLKIEGYKVNNPVQGNVSDDVAINHIQNEANSTLLRTAWLKIEDNKFSFSPKDLGFDGSKAYIITYYTCIVNPEQQYHLKIHNDFKIEGNAKTSDGKTITIPNINVDTETIIQGENHFRSEKKGWYYERPTSTPNPHWKNGELYWCVKISGNKIPKGMKIKDFTNQSEQKLYENESLVGVYKGCFPTNQSLENFININELEKSNRLKKLDGVYQPSSRVAKKSNHTGDYQWEVKKDGQYNYLFLTFNKEIELNEEKGEALYAIIKTAPQKLPQGKRTSKDFINKLQTYHLGSGQWVNEDDAKLTVYGSNEVFKETQGAYTYDGTTWKTLVSRDSRHDNANLISKSLINEPGTYIEWLVHINWDGTMSGLAEIEDQLPAGVELSYVRYYWLSPFYTGQSIPTTSEIEELQGNENWLRQESNVGSQESNNPNRKCIYYYNKDTGQVRWNIEGLQSGGQKNDARAVEFQVVCKVTDPKVLMGGKEVTLNNKINVTNNHAVYTDSDNITFTKNTLNKTGEYNTSIHGGRYPFKIELNPLGESLIPNVETVTVVDELSTTLTIDPQSIKILDKKGNTDITDQCHIRIEETSKGQIMYLTVPNSRHLEITYDTFVNAKPDETITISNKAHWQGYDVTNSGDVTVNNFSYSAGGSAGSDKMPSLKIVKYDKENISNKLSGATFSVEKVNDNLESTNEKHIAVTDSNGEAIFSDSSDQTENWMTYNTIYCIREEQAPSGYVKDETPYYFAIAKGENKLQNYPHDVHVWYQTPQYTFSAYNRKGEIKVEKEFQNSNGAIIEPLDGTYRFGIYENKEQLEHPLQTLMITYNGGKITYQRDDLLISEPIFTDLDINESYSIYELDDEGKPMKNNEIGSISGKTFTVSYRGNENIALNDGNEGKNTVHITNKTKQFNLPKTGGNGTVSYFVTGSMLLLISVIGYSLKKKRGHVNEKE